MCKTLTRGIKLTDAYSVTYGHSLNLPTSHCKARGLIPDHPCEMCSAQGGTGTGLSLGTLVFPCQYHSISALYTSSSTRCSYPKSTLLIKRAGLQNTSFKLDSDAAFHLRRFQYRNLFPFQGKLPQFSFTLRSRILYSTATYLFSHFMFKHKMVSFCGMLRHKPTIQCHYTRTEKRLAWKHLYCCTITLSTVKFWYI